MLDRVRRNRRDRASADALQRALERPEAHGADAGAGTSRATGLDDETARLLGLARTLRQAAAAGPEPDFAGVLEHRLREEAVRLGTMSGGQLVLRTAPRRSRVPAFAAVAASVLLVVGVARASVISLPGDALYGFKERGRAVRIAAASSRGEAMLRVGFARHRFAEVNQLVDEHQASATGVSGSPGSVLAVGPVMMAEDDEFAALIAGIIEKAEQDLQAAAIVLLESADEEGLAELQEVARIGVQTVADVTEVVPLPQTVKDPVLAAAVQLQTIEHRAATERGRIASASAPTPTPCVVPAATAVPAGPAGSPSPSPDATEKPRPTSTPSGDKRDEPTPSPTPTPTPTPTPAPTTCAPTPSPASSATPSPTPGGGATEPASTKPPTPDRTSDPAPATQEPAQPTPDPSDDAHTDTRTTVRPSSSPQECSWGMRMIFAC